MRRAIVLDMQYHTSSGRWCISTTGQKVQFPDPEIIEKLWETHVPGCGELFVGNSISSKIFSLYVEVGSGSTKAQRTAFLKALGAECN